MSQIYYQCVHIVSKIKNLWFLYKNCLNPKIPEMTRIPFFIYNVSARISLLLLLLIAVAPNSFAEFKISGKILSENDSTPIAGALCKLIADGEELRSVASAEDGLFSIESDVHKALLLNISASGFADYDISLAGLKKNTDLGSIYLSLPVALQELVVTTERRTESKGKTIVFPSSKDVKASSDALTLLNKLQLDGLQINPINRSMSVFGNKVVILINGIPSSQDDVNALNPKDILKVEYSRYVPARYADSGAGGLINITLKERADGGSVYIWGRGCPTTGFVDGNIRGSYHQGPSQFTLSYNPTWRSYNKVYDHSESTLIGNDFKVDLSQDAVSPFYYLGNPINIRYVYRPKESFIFSATFNAGIFNDGRSSKGDTYDSVLGTYYSRSKSKSKSFTPSLDLYMRKDFNEHNSLELEVVGTLSETDYRKTLTDTFESGKIDDYTTDTDNSRRSLISEISYVLTFANNAELSAGYQNTISDNSNTYKVTEYKATQTENNNYIYLQLSKQAGPVYLRLSTGEKLFWMRNDINKRHFIRNLSSALASWKINSVWNLSYQFNYSPGIPGLASLTDHPQQTSLYMISNGNPDLKVSEYISNSLSLRFKKNIWTASINFQQSHTANPTFSDISYIGDKIFLSNSRNFNSQQNYFAWISFGFNGLAEMFGANISIYDGYYKSKGHNWSNSLNSISGNLNLWWNKGPFTISYWRNLPGKSLWGTTVSKDENTNGLEVQYKPNKHWTLNLGWWYMFSSKGTQYPQWNYSLVNPGTWSRYIKNNANMICISFSYQADFGSIFKTSRRGLNNKDNGSSLLRQ